MKRIAGIAGLAVAGLLAGCGGGEDPTVATNDAVVPATSATTVAVVQTPFTFPSGVTAFGTAASTEVKFTSSAATPAFEISSGGNTATGTTTFGSCHFNVTASTFPAGHPLAAGQTVTVNPCNLNVDSSGVAANGVATTRSVALVLGVAASSGTPVTVSVNPGGQLTLNGTSVGTVTLAAVTGA